MELKCRSCGSDETWTAYQVIEEMLEDDYLEKSVMKRTTAQFITFYDHDLMFGEKTWVGYAAVERLRDLSIGTLLDDITEEDVFEESKAYVEKHMKENGYYLHVLNIFEPYRGVGCGRQAESALFDALKAPVLLYSVSDSESFWARQGYDFFEDYYYTKGSTVLTPC